MRIDPVYNADQNRCRQEWSKGHPGYWKKYRDNHPEQVERNRDLQMVRDGKRRKRVVQACPSPDMGMGASMLAKMDSLKASGSSGKGMFSGQFWLVPVLAKMDALKVNMYTITGC